MSKPDGDEESVKLCGTGGRVDRVIDSKGDRQLRR
jgi:hypothetical protein